MSGQKTIPDPTPAQAPSVAPWRDPYRLVLLALLLIYIGIFSSQAFAQHAAMRTHKADLGQIDQAVWNSSRGRFLEMTDNGYISTRMTDHVEPILILISPVLWLWDDVRALLFLQVLAVAAGAWLLYELAQMQLEKGMTSEERRQIWKWEPIRRLTRPLALVLAIAFLLTPQLQSAVLTEFHAAPLAVPLILWALWAVAARRWGQFVVAALLVAAVKEEMALLAAGLGLWAIWCIVIVDRYTWRRDANGGKEPSQTKPLSELPKSGLLAAIGVTMAALLWFVIATFVIVPANAVDVYGVAESGYFQRYGALGDSPADILRSFFTQPSLVWQIATEPARLDYLLKLMVPYGFLALLAPEIVLLSLPVLLANLLSAYPAQYYGEFHYSAPVVVYFAVAAAYGVARLWRWASKRSGRTSADFQHMPAASATTMNLVALFSNARTALRPMITVLLCLWLLLWAIGGTIWFGRGPGGARYDPAVVTPHHRLLSRFTDQLPAEAAVTATAAVHPHVSHRRYVYQFPLGLEEPGQADWALLDVTTATDMAPGDVKTTVEQMLAQEWSVVDAADGYLLLHKENGDKEIPDAFYDFAREPSAMDNGDVVEGAAPLQFAGAEVTDWERWRQTQITSLWEVGEGFEGSSMAPQVELRTPAGETIYRFADAMPPALVWYPPWRWQPGETVRITTLPLYLPRGWGLAVEKTPGLQVADRLVTVGSDEDVLVAAFRRGPDDTLLLWPPQFFGSDELDGYLREAGEPDLKAQFGEFRVAEGETVRMSAWLPDRQIWPGATIDAWIAWQAMAGWPTNQQVFVHLRPALGQPLQNDGLPRYFVRYAVDPTLSEHGSATDWRQIEIPIGEEVPAGEWIVAMGLYDPVTGQRATVESADGTPVGEELVIGTLQVGTPPTPDQTCALIPTTCASQPGF